MVKKVLISVLLLATAPMLATRKIVYKLKPPAAPTPPPEQLQPKKLYDTIAPTTDGALEYLQHHLPINPIIVQAGAHNGIIARKMATQWPLGTIYAFEALPENFAILEKNCNNLPHVKPIPALLSTKTGFSEFFIVCPGIDNALLIIPTTTLDEWAANNTIEHIDLLWLDMHGQELAMLKKSPQMIANTLLVYVEVEFVKTYEGQSFFDEVKEFLTSQDFKLVAQDFDDATSQWFGNAIFMKKPS